MKHRILVRTLTILSLFLGLPDGVFSQDLYTIQGILREKGTRKPIADANIFALPYKQKVTTDKNGEFQITLPEGEFTWIVNRSGYLKLEKNDAIGVYLYEEIRELYIEKTSYQGFETTIYGRGQKRDSTTRSLKQEDFITAPGSGGDPIKAVENLPGVARTTSFDSRVIIQGAGPQDTRYTIDGHEVPSVFHFGALTSVFFSESIERVDYLNVGYGPEYGRAMGGLITLWTKNPRKDRLHGIAFVDLFKAGALIEGPTGDEGAFSLGVRQSYIGPVLRTALKDNEDFNLTVAPAFGDISGVYTTPLSPIDDFRLVAIGSRDRLAFLFSEPVKQDPSIRGEFETRSDFVRLIPQLVHRHSARTISRWSLGMGQDWRKTAIGDNFFQLKLTTATLRGEVEREFSKSLKSYFGFDNRYNRAEIDLNLPTVFFDGGIANPFGSGQQRKAHIETKRNVAAIYNRNEIKPSGSAWTLIPSARVDYFARQESILPAPRLAASYQLSPSLKLQTANGLYYQPPQPQEDSTDFGNPDIKAPRAWHASLGAEKDFRGGGSEGWTISSGLFYRYFDQLVVQSTEFTTVNGVTQPERYNNKGRGRAYGYEMLTKYRAYPFSGVLSYTLSKSERWNPNSGIQLFQYDQTHNVNLVASIELPRNWKISTRIRYVTGSPFTPVTEGIFDSDNDVYSPVRGPIFSERLSPFFQTDLRVDKRWIYDRWILSLYLDIQNLSNHRNVESVQYAYDYSSKAEVQGLPILPTLGVKGEF